MQKLLKTTFSSGFFLLLAIASCYSSQAKEIRLLTQKLEQTLNGENKSRLYEIVSEEIAKDIQQKYNDFINSFPNAKWTIKPLKKLKDNRQSIELIVTGKKKEGNHKYSLFSKQKLAIDIENGIIIAKEILDEYSILNSNKDKLNITLSIPDTVLTGSNYDIDLILENPLQGRIIAGGLIALPKDSKSNNYSQQIQLTPIGSGGLFKSVRAPFQPGKQRWAALIAHPDGVLSITKSVRVVSSSRDLIP